MICFIRVYLCSSVAKKLEYEDIMATQSRSILRDARIRAILPHFGTTR